MYSKATIAGHPVHPMLIAYPVAGYTGTLVGLRRVRRRTGSSSG